MVVEKDIDSDNTGHHHDLKIAKNKLYIAMIFEKSFLPIDNDILQIISEKFILYDKSI